MTDTTIAARLTELTHGERVRTRRIVERIAARRADIARAEGEIARLTAELAGIAHANGERSANPDGPEYARRAMAAEIAAATRVHPATARAQMTDAECLAAHYPRALEALEAGRISRRHAAVIAEAGDTLDVGARASLDACATALAAERTPGDLRRIAKKQAAELAPRSLRERHHEARRRRLVTVADREDGMSELLVSLPTFHARAVYDRLTELARRVRADRRAARREYERTHGHAPEEGWTTPVIGQTDGADPLSAAATDRRTFDQLRTDLLADILLTAAPTGHELHASGTDAVLEHVQATVQVTIPASLILDPAHGTSWIDGGDLVSPDTARSLAGAAAGWERLFIRPETGTVIAADRYRPDAAQRRRLLGRDMTCRFPGCTALARQTDLDHTHDWAHGGETSIENLACLCRGHHTMKHHSGWRVRQVGDGLLEWTSPTGAVYVDEPTSRVFFRDSPEAVRVEDERRSERDRRRTTRDADLAQWYGERAEEDREPSAPTPRVVAGRQTWTPEQPWDADAAPTPEELRRHEDEEERAEAAFVHALLSGRIRVPEAPPEEWFAEADASAHLPV